MRLFLGTFLSPSNQEFYSELVGDLTRRYGDILRAIPRRSAHLTYAFCADTGTSGIDALLAVCEEAARPHHGFDIRLGSPHVISAGSTPRLVVADLLTGGDVVRRLTADLAAECQAAFPALAWAPSREPHVTLARFRKHARRPDRDTIVRALLATDHAREARDDRLSRVQVVESLLTPAGPEYRVVGEVRLS